MADIEVKCAEGDYTVLVDDADYEWLNGMRWFDLNGYAVTSDAPGTPSIKGMHRLIMGVTDRRIKVDHKHGNRRDCRRTELQTLSGPANFKKKHVPLKPTNEPGIFWSEFKKRYIVILYHPENEARFFFGDHKTIEKAISVRNAERDIGGYTETRSPRSWDKLKTPQDATETPPTP
jgi:hypothetical protein